MYIYDVKRTCHVKFLTRKVSMQVFCYNHVIALSTSLFSSIIYINMTTANRDDH